MKKMNAFRKATRRITALATSAVMASSAVFGAGLSNYPDNFQNTGVTVVYGAGAQASDNTVASAIVDSLGSSSGGASYVVTYTSSSSSSGSGEKVNAVSKNTELNYGERLENVTETGGFDSSDSDLLDDHRFENDIDDEDYEQTLELLGGLFNYALRDEVDGVDEIAAGIFYENGEAFARYTLDLDNAISLEDDDFDDDLIGSSLEIMGNEFIVADVTRDEMDGSDNDVLEKLVLVGGSQRQAVSEGDSISVPIGGRTYDIRVVNIASDEALFEVNGNAHTINEFDSDEISGLTIAVTDLIESSQLTKGTAIFVVGGQKVTLEEGNVKINDEDLNDIYEDKYDVDVEFVGSDGFDDIVITYRVDDHTLLEEGDSLKDILFDAFELVYDGTNEPDYSEIRVSSDGDDIVVSGVTEEDEDFNRVLPHSNGVDVTLRGNKDDDRMIHSKSKMGTSPGVVVDTKSVTFDLTSNVVEGSSFLLTKDQDEAYLYEISNVGNADEYETDFDEILTGNDADNVEFRDWGSKLELKFTATNPPGNDKVVIALDQLGNKIPFENEVYLELDGGEEGAVSSPDLDLSFKLDEGDLDSDENADTDLEILIGYTWDGGSDEEFDIGRPKAVSPTNAVGVTTRFVNEDDADNEDGNSDVQTYVTSYGVMVKYDSDEKDEVTIMVPDEQVSAMVSVVFGSGSSSQSMTETFSTMEAAESRAGELRDDGMRSVEVNEMSTSSSNFAVSGPVLDTQVSGTSNMVVVGGPAVNRVAANLLGVSYPSYGSASGLSQGQGMVRLFESVNSVLVYGWSAGDTRAASERLRTGNLDGSVVNVN